MKLKYKYFNDYICDLTDDLDKWANIDNDKKDWFYHYLFILNINKIKDCCLPIRVPGGTLGGVWVDKDGCITKIVIDTDYVVKTYPENINELIQKYIGYKITYCN